MNTNTFTIMMLIMAAVMIVMWLAHCVIEMWKLPTNPLSRIEECPACGGRLFRDRPDGVRICRNPGCGLCWLGRDCVGDGGRPNNG